MLGLHSVRTTFRGIIDNGNGFPVGRVDRGQVAYFVDLSGVYPRGTRFVPASRPGKFERIEGAMVIDLGVHPIDPDAFAFAFRREATRPSRFPELTALSAWTGGIFAASRMVPPLRLAPVALATGLVAFLSCSLRREVVKDQSTGRILCKKGGHPAKPSSCAVLAGGARFCMAQSISANARGKPFQAACWRGRARRLTATVQARGYKVESCDPRIEQLARYLSRG